MTTPVSCVWQAGCLLGEGVLWSSHEAAVYWVDIKQPAILRYCPADGTRAIWQLGEMIGSLALRTDGGFIGAMRSGIYAFDLPAPGTPVAMRLVATPDQHRSTDRFNDGACAPDGSFWAGTMDDTEEEDRGWFYRLLADGRLQRIVGPYRVCNGPCFSPDGSQAYFADSTKRVIYRLAVSGVVEAEPFVRIADSDGYPDGMTTDAQGRLWVALWDGWSLLCISPEGQILEKIAMPVARPTRCAFGGPDLGTLYVSSARSRDAASLDGSLFALTPGARGWPNPTFSWVSISTKSP